MTPKQFDDLVRLRPRAGTAAPVEDEALMVELTKTLFAQRRKTILNNLRAGMKRLGLTDESEAAGLLSFCGLDPKRRAETLSFRIKPERRRSRQDSDAVIGPDRLIVLDAFGIVPHPVAVDEPPSGLFSRSKQVPVHIGGDT